MGRSLVDRHTAALILAILAAAVVITASASQAADTHLRRAQFTQQQTPSGGFAPLRAVTTGFTDGLDKISRAFTPTESVVSAEDPISLSSQGRPSPQLYVAVARLAEQTGKFGEADQRYQQALKLAPDDLGALLGYARMKDRQGRLDEAVQLYQAAARVHPNESAVFNDLGLCHARRKDLTESIVALKRAVDLNPKEPRYRNNIATVLVEMGDIDTAFMHMAAVHSPAVAYYNVGFLLHKKGKSREAAALFSHALTIDPSLNAARVWLAKVGESKPPETQLAPRSQPAPVGLPASGAVVRSRYADPSVQAPDLRTANRPSAPMTLRPAAPSQTDFPRAATPEPRQPPLVQEQLRRTPTAYRALPTSGGRSGYGSATRTPPLPSAGTTMSRPSSLSKQDDGRMPVVQPLPPVPRG